ncbi:UDP-N-acetylglucosamine 2-epimerase (non-hydrolyzing) [Candidatus Micrarchaeota archaeon]|nr:UDP-N-acetylglucosamine 2-epimerase (non-hydrolyzing) [Candidatus Micrarchaeota archaeon]
MIFLVLGTRPEIIKFSPIIRELQKQEQQFKIIHSNQHYSPEMDAVFFEELKLKKADYDLNAGSGTQAEQLSKIMLRTEKILKENECDMVVVQGDTNTTFAAALAASRLHIPIAHVEAGLRSFDRRMPEEANRILADQLSFLHFAATEEAEKNLEAEGVGKKELIFKNRKIRQKIIVTGNTAVDATLQNIPLAKNETLAQYTLAPNDYVLVTSHRAENVDSKEFLENLISALKELKKTIVWPIHPRTMKKMEEFGLREKIKAFKIIPPLGYLEFLALEKNASLIVTDSGGVQEEACTLKVPCVTVRKSTDRPETISVGANVLGGVEKESILKACRQMLSAHGEWNNPFGDGKSSEKIVDELISWTEAK